MAFVIPTGGDAGIFRALADYACGLRFEKLPPTVLQRANLCVMDLLASTYAAVAGRGAQALRAYAEAVNPAPQATLWGSGLRVGAIEAATANGATAYEAEYDDGNTLGGHWGSSSIPAILALAERDGVGAQQVLVAIVAAYEVGNRISQPFSRGLLARGVHYPGGMGGVAATAGAGRMMGLDAERLAAALGFACLLPVAPYFPSYEGSDAKNLYSGWPNHCGLHFAALAQAGYRGSPQLLEGRDGLAHVLGWEGSSEELRQRVLDGLDNRHAILDTYFKPYPCCRWIHAPVQALLDLVTAHNIPVTEIAAIEVAAPAFVGRMYFDAGPFLNATQARYSAPYALAAAALYGRLGQPEFEGRILGDAAVHALARRVSFAPAADLEQAFPPAFSARVRVTTREGRVYGGKSVLPWGPEAPPEFAELAVKFRGIMGPLCSNPVTDDWLAYFEAGLQADADLHGFFGLLRRSVVRSHS
ncbi:MmgE/PrpD family protein [Variovorax beijingensis]|uniref:MmgE/PrpD family protein n=1 Tax=Variovorax beijingensis TaxID=2496117 RepID=UPI003F69BA7E